MSEKQSLLDKAKSITTSRTNKAPDNGRLELDLAFIRGEINGVQYSAALGKNASQAIHLLGSSLRKAYKNGLITIIIK